jgi:hypothetical protein
MFRCNCFDRRIIIIDSNCVYIECLIAIDKFINEKVGVEYF